MKIKSLSVRNLRIYGDDEQTLEFDTTKNVTILLGDNGAGKTSLLYGCTVLLSQFFEPFPGCTYKKFTLDDVRNISNTNKADYLHVGMTLDPDGEFIQTDMYQKGDNKKETPSSTIKQIKDYALNLKKNIDEGNQLALPVIAFYGTERGHIESVERRRDFNAIFPRWDIYKPDALDSVTNFKRFFTWFERNEDLERREQIARKNWDYKSPVLEAVRNALRSFFDGKYDNPRVEMGPLRFVMDNKLDPNNTIESRIEHMSDGYRITLALVADIASRMAEGNPTFEESGLDNPLMAEGIVLIDEIDLHLHPKLQREVLRKLTNIFPNVQFIVSTHSPSVVIGALDFAQIVKLEHGTIKEMNTSEFEKYDVSLLLLSGLFGLDNVRTTKFKEIEEKVDNLLNKNTLSDSEENDLKRYTRELRTYGYSNGEEKR